MRTSSLTRYAACALAAGALLAGCNGGQSPGAATVPSVAQSNARMHHQRPSARVIALTTRSGKVPVQRFNHGKSWIRPDAGKKWLLYASDVATGTVDIYNYRVKAGKLFGQITGFNFPYGQCIDSAGNVYVADFGSAEISEFAHGGISPIASASVEFGLPIGCSVDPTTGNVAVSVFEGSSSGSGGIDVFAGGLGGTQTLYSDPNLFVYWPPGYDPSGNLFVEGENQSFASPSLAELPAGSGTFTDLSGLTIGFPASVQWDGFYVAATDQGYLGGFTTAVNRITVSGSAVTVVRTTELTDDCDGTSNFMDAVQPFLNGTTKQHNAIAAGNLDCTSRFGFWNYTTGGNPKRVLPTAIAPGSGYGQAVSPPGRR